MPGPDRTYLVRERTKVAVVSTMRRGSIAFRVMAAMLLAAGGCHDASPDSIVSPPPPPCAGVYSSAVNSCVAESGCIGFECFYVWDQCSADAKRGPLADCCLANYPTDEGFQKCMDSLGQGP
jgi:hypothetical protein